MSSQKIINMPGYPPDSTEPTQSKITLLEMDRVFKRIVGDTLTIIDACVTDTVQRDAIKSLIKKDLYGDMDKLFNWMQSNQIGSINGSNFPF